MIGKLIAGLSSPTENSQRYDGALSYAAEWHSMGIGFAVGMFGGPAIQSAVLAYAVGRGGKQRELADDPHIRDLAAEPAYAVAAMAAGAVIRPLLPL